MPKVVPKRVDIPDALAEVDEATRSKIMSVLARFGTITFAMLALGPDLAMFNSDLPPQECVELGENPKVRAIAERAILFMALKLAEGKEADWQERTLVGM